MPISKNGKMYYTQEQYEQARYAANALDYARSRGYNLAPSGGGKYFKLAEHDSMVFTKDGRWYWNSRGVSGGALEFCIYYEQMSLPEAVLTLTEGQNFQQQASPPVPEPVRQAALQTVSPVVSQMPPLVVEQTVSQPQPVQRGSDYGSAIYRGEQAPIPQWTNLPSSGAQATAQAAANRAPVPPAQVQEKPAFQLPERAANFKRVFAYLCKERAIEPAVVKEMIAQQCLYESVKHLDNGNEIHNACFVSHDPDGNPCSAFQRSLHDSGNPFKRDVLGSNKDYGWLLRGEPGAVAVFEASIDAASYASFLLQTPSNDPRPDLLALGGLNPAPLNHYLQTHPETQAVFLGLDMDEAGREATNRFQTMLKKQGVQVWDISADNILHGKDWNAELKWYRQQEQKTQAIQQPQAQQSQVRQFQAQQPQQPSQQQIQSAQTAGRTQLEAFSVYRLKNPDDISRVCRKGNAKPKQYHRIHMEPLKLGDTLQSVVKRLSGNHPPQNYNSLPLIQSDVLVMHQNGNAHAYLFTPQGIQERPELVNVEFQQVAPSMPQPGSIAEMEM